MKFSLPKSDFERAVTPKSFRMPATYQYYNALSGMAGKFGGFAGGPYGALYNEHIGSLQTPYGKISMKD